MVVHNRAGVICFEFHLIMLLILVVALVCMETHFPLVSGETVIRCMDREREALLEFKRSVTDDPDNRLESWGSDEHQKECCEWEGVECSDTATAHVTALFLGGKSLKFRGELPLTLKNCQNLKLIDIGGNKLTGNIPPWFGNGNYTHLTYLSLRHNRFYGGIPSDICNLNRLQILDLSGNNISGKIPQCFNNFTSLVDKGTSDASSFISYIFGLSNIYTEYALVQWKYQESEYRKTLGFLKLIDLSSNRLVGDIPRTLSSLKGLISLNLSRNSLTGHIDSNIGEMEMLECLDLSSNKLSGEIPIGLAQLHYLAVLDLANNNLSGKIPSGTQLQSFNASSYAGNNDLCGLPLKLCPQDHTPINNEDVEEEDNGIWRLSFMQEFGMMMTFGCIVGFWGVVGSLILKKSWRGAYFNFMEAVGDCLYVRVILFINRLKRR